jgi:hypothetical protein
VELGKEERKDFEKLLKELLKKKKMQDINQKDIESMLEVVKKVQTQPKPQPILKKPKSEDNNQSGLVVDRVTKLIKAKHPSALSFKAKSSETKSTQSNAESNVEPNLEDPRDNEDPPENENPRGNKNPKVKTPGSSRSYKHRKKADSAIRGCQKVELITSYRNRLLLDRCIVFCDDAFDAGRSLYYDKRFHPILSRMNCGKIRLFLK